MGRMKLYLTLFALAWLLSHAGDARGQLVGLADDIIVISKGASDRAAAGHKKTLLGHAPVRTTRHSNSIRAAAETRWKRHDNPALSRRIGRHGKAKRAFGDGAIARRTFGLRGAKGQWAPSSDGLAMRQLPALQRRVPPLYGLLELPSGELEGPPNGMTLDQAIENLMCNNADLRHKRYEIPQARADVLTASLRANPLYFISASNVPYQAYSPQRFGAVEYTPTLVQPVDINNKRGARTEAASRHCACAEGAVPKRREAGLARALPGLHRRDRGERNVAICRSQPRWLEGPARSLAGANAGRRRQRVRPVEPGSAIRDGPVGRRPVADRMASRQASPGRRCWTFRASIRNNSNCAAG